MDLLTQLIDYEKKLEKKFQKNTDIFTEFYQGDERNYSQFNAKKTGIRKLDLYNFNNGEVRFMLSQIDKKMPLEQTLPMIFSPVSFLRIIGDFKRDWKEEIENSCKESSISLEDGIVQWLKNNPALKRFIFRKLKHSDYMEKQWESESSWIYKSELCEGLSSLYGFLQDENVIWNPRLIGLRPDFYITSILINYRWNSNITTEDMLLVLLRDELGIHSFCELRSIESALCYLIYRDDWIVRCNKHKSNLNLNNLREIRKDFLDSEDCLSNKTNFSQYLEKVEGFNGELWASYDEFLHDEWRDDDFEVANIHLNNLYHELRQKIL